MKLTSNNTLIAFIFLSVLVLGAIFYISSTQKKRASQTSALINHTEEVLLHSEQLVVSATDNLTGSRGYVITGNSAFLDSLEKSKRTLRHEIDTLRLLTADNQSQQTRLDSIEVYANKRMAWSDSTIHTRNQQGLAAATALVNMGEGRQIARRFRTLVRELQDEENRLLVERRAANEEAEDTLNKMFFAGAFILLFLMIALFQKTRLDIKAQKKGEAALLELNKDLHEKVKELNAANNEMESFSYSVSHDLRAPLRRITGFTTILEEEYASKLDDEARRIAGIIRKNTARMGALIDDLLTFSRMARKDLVKTSVVSNDMVREVIEGTNAGNGGQQIEWAVHPLPPVQGDISTLRQVWSNLISNAVKYSRNTTHPRVEVGSFHQNNQTVFFVKDNGAGFDAQYRDKLFKVFHRLHSEQEFEGTGVGLAIVEKIVSKHGGSVWAEGEVDKGATFYFSLPAGS